MELIPVLQLSHNFFKLMVMVMIRIKERNFLEQRGEAREITGPSNE